MQPFRLTSFFILILLLGTVVAAACTNDDRASTVAETPPLAAPTPDVEVIVETAVREMLEAILTPAPAPTPDIEPIVETVLQRTTGTLLETLVTGLSVDTETTETSFGKFYQGRTLHVAVMEIKQMPEVRYATIDPEDVIRHYRLTPAEEDLELVMVRLKVQNHTATSAIFTVDQQGAELRDFFRGTYQPIDILNRAFQDKRGQSSATVRLKGGNCFDPQRLNITLGTAVNWVNDDNVDHFVRLGAAAGQLETTEPSSLKPGESFSYTFEELGEWDYRCGDSQLTEGAASILVEEESDKYAVEEQPIVFITGPFQLQQDMGIDGWMVFEAPKGTKFRSIRWRAGDSVTISF